MEKKYSRTKVITDFTKKIKRFKKYGGVEPDFLNHEEKKETPKPELSKEQLEKIAKETFKKFISPYEVFGKGSAIANQLEKDKANIVSAYNLHKSITELNQKSENQDTFVRNFTIDTPLTKRDRYTLGEDFIYLQLWFIIFHCKNNPDFIPILEKEEKINSWKLYFIQKEFFHPNPKELEIQEIILSSIANAETNSNKQDNIPV